MGVCALKLPQLWSGTLVVFQDYLTKWPEAYADARQDTLMYHSTPPQPRTLTS